ncbi:MAG: matrixin family metalloprotease [Thermoanaerobaculia bacterium]
MATSKRKSTKKSPKQPKAAASQPDNALQARKAATKDPEVHVFGPRGNFVCDTEPTGHATPKGRSILEIVVDASEGFIPLWAKRTTLRWRFRDTSMKVFAKPAAAKNYIRKLFGEALLAWGDAVPIKFAEKDDNWDFEIVMKKSDDCDVNGCVLASAFFPDAGRHQLTFYPRMFQQSRDEQVETLAHEIGHAFGLRHFFAKELENGFPAEIFGVHSKFSIMNYGVDSRLTDNDKKDLKRMYQAAWSGELKNINGTPIKFVKPFHTMAGFPDNVVAFGAPAVLPPELQPAVAAYRD